MSLFGFIEEKLECCKIYFKGENKFYKDDEYKKLTGLLSFDLEMMWEGVRLHLISSKNDSGSVVYPNSGGINNQPVLFWEMVNICDDALLQAEHDRKELIDKFKTTG